MVKVLAGLVAAALIATAGYFGFEFYVQQRVAGEVETTFAAMRASGAKATHGKVTFDLWRRTITVADISGESAAQPPVSVKIARFAAAGVKQAEAGRFSADRIEATDVAVAGTMAVQARLQFEYKAPRIEIASYSGPAGPLRPLDPSSPADINRFMVEQFAAVTAASITAPTVTGSMTAPGAPASGLGDYTYSNLAMRDIRDGKIAAMTVERMTFTATLQNAGKAEKMTGEMVDLAASDLDATAALAMFDPARANDDKYHRVYRQMTTGPYTASFQSGLKLRIDGMSASDIGLKPSKMQFPQLMAIVESVPPPGTTPTPAQTREMMEKIAGIYEGVSIGNVEVRGLSMEAPNGPVRLGAIRMIKLENGKIGEFALEGLDARSPQGPVKIGRFALKSLDIANLLRTSAQFASVPNPSPDQLASLLLLLDGGEIRGLVAPYKTTNQPVNIDALTLAWGQFVGPIPTSARASLKMSGPVDTSDPPPFGMLAGAGMNSATINFDLGAAWSEPTRSFAIAPVTIEVGNVFTAAARMNLANVARETFSLNPLQAAIMAAQVEAGPVEIALRDTGGVELMIAQYARTQNVSTEAARAAIVDNIKSNAMQMAAVNPDVMAIAGALTRFIETPRGTLTVKLTPRGKVAVMELLTAAKTDPLTALARFEVEATNGR